MRKLAPIVLFVYNRPDHTERTLEALMKNELAAASELFIFADGAKANASVEALKNIEKTRAIIRKKNWCAQVSIIESPVNKGLSQSVIEGVTKIVNEHGKIIVLEDDLVTSPFFLEFMNEALTIYETSEIVACISGYIYPVKEKLPETFFIKGTDCWGWATWKRAWDDFEKDGSKLLKQLKSKSLTEAFDLEGAYHFTKMLKEQIIGLNDSWAIRWHAAAFLKNKYCLYPGSSLVQNIGADDSGTHGGTTDRWSVILSSQRINLNPIPVEENISAKAKIAKYLNDSKKSNHSIIRKGINLLKSINLEIKVFLKGY